MPLDDRISQNPLIKTLILNDLQRRNKVCWKKAVTAERKALWEMRNEYAKATSHANWKSAKNELASKGSRASMLGLFSELGQYFPDASEFTVFWERANWGSRDYESKELTFIKSNSTFLKMYNFLFAVFRCKQSFFYWLKILLHWKLPLITVLSWVIHSNTSTILWDF